MLIQLTHRNKDSKLILIKITVLKFHIFFYCFCHQILFINITDFFHIAEQTYKQLQDNVQFFKDEEAQKRVNEKLRPGKPKNASDLFGIDGNFKKLDIDWSKQQHQATAVFFGDRPRQTHAIHQ